MLNKDIITTYTNLASLRESSQQRFPARVSFAITRNIRLLQPIVEDFDASRRELILQYGTPTGEDDQYIINDIPAFNKEASDLENADTEVNLTKINISDIESLDLTVQEMDALYPMIREEEG